VHLEADPAALSARVDDAARAATALAQLTGSHIAVAEFKLGQPSLDEVFLALTGHPAEETVEESAA
jgi:ABC-2 type transport system ATP-binding protein